ncbi:ferritin-like domain-containing protein [Dichomitus squalens]|nr:ferritin-like domain-containing protein [Dichomitus squalens]
MLKASILFAFTALAAAVSAAPTAPAVSDVDVLQLALTLEHLESTFYNTALDKFTAQDFENAGYPAWVRGRFAQIAGHEATHVQFLTQAIGANAAPACEYDFGTSMDDPTSFAKMSRIFENVGSSAYLGAASLIQNKDYLTAAASILGAEISHTGWVSSSVLKVQPWSGSFSVPLAPSAAFSLAREQPFIKSCPQGSPQLPVKQLPQLTLSNAQPQLGSTVSLSFPTANFSNGTLYAAWVDGLTVEYTAINAKGSTQVPNGLQGVVYVVVVSSKETPSDDNLVSGAALIAYDFGSSANNTVSGSPVQ